MTDADYADIIRANCQPLTPLATDVEPNLPQIDGIQAVMFDVYGTLFISASGDIGLDTGDHRTVAFLETSKQFELASNVDAEMAVKLLEAAIKQEHRNAKANGVQFPEVDIVTIWKQVLQQLFPMRTKEIDYARFALEYEVRANPVWPMPNAGEVLSWLSTTDLVMGIVSNAQFFTPLLFPALLSKDIIEFGFRRDLSYFSYAYGRAKPGNELYEFAKQKLQEYSIPPESVLYIGNDMLNDVTAAASVGFRTALFAGDGRSLRRRQDDPRVAGVQPDITLTHLEQLRDCIR